MRRRDSSKGVVYYENEEGESVYITPAPPPSGPPADPTTPTSYVQVVKKVFEDALVWNINHGLNGTPAITLWKGGFVRYGFGTQPFGTSPFGGTTQWDPLEEATHIPEIIEVDEDNITAEWATETSGKAICVG